MELEAALQQAYDFAGLYLGKSPQPSAWIVISTSIACSAKTSQ